MDHKQRGFKATVVGLADKTVCVYKDKFLVNKITTPDVVSAILFGKFGREEGSLIMVTKGNLAAIVLYIYTNFIFYYFVECFVSSW